MSETESNSEQGPMKTKLYWTERDEAFVNQDYVDSIRKNFPNNHGDFSFIGEFTPEELKRLDEGEDELPSGVPLNENWEPVLPEKADESKQ